MVSTRCTSGSAPAPKRRGLKRRRTGTAYHLPTARECSRPETKGIETVRTTHNQVPPRRGSAPAPKRRGLKPSSEGKRAGLSIKGSAPAPKRRGLKRSAPTRFHRHH